MKKIYLPTTETKVIRKALELYNQAIQGLAHTNELQEDIHTLKILMDLPVSVTIPMEYETCENPLGFEIPYYSTDYLLAFNQSYVFKSASMLDEFTKRIKSFDQLVFVVYSDDPIAIKVTGHIKDMEQVQKIYDELSSANLSEIQRLRFIQEDIENLVRFIKDKRLDGIFELMDKDGATGWNYVSNIEVASDLTYDEPNFWKNER